MMQFVDRPFPREKKIFRINKENITDLKIALISSWLRNSKSCAKLLEVTLSKNTNITTFCKAGYQTFQTPHLEFVVSNLLQ